MRMPMATEFKTYKKKKYHPAWKEKKTFSVLPLVASEVCFGMATMEKKCVKGTKLCLPFLRGNRASMKNYLAASASQTCSKPRLTSCRIAPIQAARLCDACNFIFARLASCKFVFHGTSVSRMLRESLIVRVYPDAILFSSLASE